MTNLKTIAAASAVVAVIACGSPAFAQDDLDDLLKDLESDLSAEVSEAAVEPTDESGPADDEEAVAEDVSEELAEVAADEGEAGEADEPVEADDGEEPEEESDEEAEDAEPADESDEEEPADDEVAADDETEEPEEEAAEDAATEEEDAVADDAAEAEEEEPAEEEPVEETEAPVESDDDQVAEDVEEDAADEPVGEDEPAVEDVAAAEEVPAPAETEPAAPAEPAPVATEQIDDAISLLAKIAGEMKDESAPAAGETAPADSAPAPVAAAPVALKASRPAPSPAFNGPDAELLSNLAATEKLRRTAYDAQAKREIAAARDALASGDNLEASKRYALALKFLNDSPATKKYRRECEQGIAESLYRAAMEEDLIGRRTNAMELMNRALGMRHPKARKQLEIWSNSEDPNANKKELSDIKHRRNDDDYKDQRKTVRRRLKRARQLLAVRDIDGALDECELVLVDDPYNQEAIRLRGAIQKKRGLILGQEYKVTHDAMIADVDRAWRPVYAPNARDLEDVASSTMKRAIGDDPERSVEQSIKQRMKEIILPTIQFRPPATIIDVVDSFRTWSKDFDRPDIPVDQRGFNFVLKTDKPIMVSNSKDEEEDADDFSSTGNDEVPETPSDLQAIPMITANNIPFDEALDLVCSSVNYKYVVSGRIVMVMPKDMSIAVMITRNYPVMAAFFEKMNDASDEMKELHQSGFGGKSASRSDEEESSKAQDWKQVFSELGVEWPEGSSIFYMKATGKLRVRNTEENLAELEKALVELNAEQRLVEIEARFVEVAQEDLNSLGFEWILNSDYTLGSGGWLAKQLGVKPGSFSSSKDNTTQVTRTNSGGAISESVTVTTDQSSDVWTRGGSGKNGAAGIKAMGGSSDYGNGNRYLSTTSNHISGEGKSTNDQFMKVNAFLGSADLSMILHMLSQRSDTDLLSAPKVLTRPGANAVIKVVTEYRYPTDYNVQLQSSSSSSSSNGGSQSAILAVVEPESFETREVGVILNVTPQLTDDGNLIDLELHTEVVDEPTWKNYGMKIPYSGNSSLQNFEGIGEIFTGLADSIAAVGGGISSELKSWIISSEVEAADNALKGLTASTSDNMTYYEAPMEQPFFHKRTIDSSISIYPGATIVMGGLITEGRKSMDDKVPFFGDLPFIGRLFRSHSEQTVKKNLLIFVTTRLVDVRGREVLVGREDSSDAEIKAAPEAEQ